METNNPVAPTPVPENISKFQRLVIKLFGKRFVCSYCAKLYTKCHSGEINVLSPIPQNGKCCPDGHEGYVKEMAIVGAIIIKRFDFVKFPPSDTQNDRS